MAYEVEKVEGPMLYVEATCGHPNISGGGSHSFTLKLRMFQRFVLNVPKRWCTFVLKAFEVSRKPTNSIS